MWEARLKRYRRYELVILENRLATVWCTLYVHVSEDTIDVTCLSISWYSRAKQDVLCVGWFTRMCGLVFCTTFLVRGGGGGWELRRRSLGMPKLGGLEGQQSSVEILWCNLDDWYTTVDGHSVSSAQFNI